MATKWEYLILTESDVSSDDEGRQGMLNRYGAEGWELVAVTETVIARADERTAIDITSYLKRLRGE